MNRKNFVNKKKKLIVSSQFLAKTQVNGTVENSLNYNNYNYDDSYDFNDD